VNFHQDWIGLEWIGDIMTEWRDWSKIVKMIKDKVAKVKIREYYNRTSCRYCATVPYCGRECTLSDNNFGTSIGCSGGHWDIIENWFEGGKYTRAQLYESAKFIADIMECDK